MSKIVTITEHGCVESFRWIATGNRGYGFVEHRAGPEERGQPWAKLDLALENFPPSWIRAVAQAKELAESADEVVAKFQVTLEIEMTEEGLVGDGYPHDWLWEELLDLSAGSEITSTNVREIK